MNHPPGGTSDPDAFSDFPPDDDANHSGLVAIVLVAAVAGLATGLVCGAFRAALHVAEVWRIELVGWTREEPALRWLIPVLGAAVFVAAARLMVRWAPEATGSGIQRVEAIARDEITPRPFHVLPTKFVGGWLSIGSGMALGLEGPSVQMGAALGDVASRSARLVPQDRRTITSALAGAGLAAAFSAPIAGALFVVEEVTRAFRTRLLIAAIVSCATALLTAQFIVGSRPVFRMASGPPAPTWQLAVFAALGLALGAMGVAYNSLVIWFLDWFEARPIRPELLAGAVGALIGLLDIVVPSITGGGEAQTQDILLGSVPFAALAVMIAVRWFLGPLCYGVGTPGGLFAPLIVLGAGFGSLLATAVDALVPTAGLSPSVYALVGMAAFFTGVVRAPLTGVVLVMELTAVTAHLVPLMVASGCALLAATALRGAPIYERLRVRMLERQ